MGAGTWHMVRAEQKPGVGGTAVNTLATHVLTLGMFMSSFAHVCRHTQSHMWAHTGMHVCTSHRYVQTQCSEWGRLGSSLGTLD